MCIVAFPLVFNILPKASSAGCVRVCGVLLELSCGRRDTVSGDCAMFVWYALYIHVCICFFYDCRCWLSYARRPCIHCSLLACAGPLCLGFVVRQGVGGAELPYRWPSLSAGAMPARSLLCLSLVALGVCRYPWTLANCVIGPGYGCRWPLLVLFLWYFLVQRQEALRCNQAWDSFTEWWLHPLGCAWQCIRTVYLNFWRPVRYPLLWLYLHGPVP